MSQTEPFCVYYDPTFLEHDTGGAHPERPERLLAVREGLEGLGEGAVQWRKPRPATLDEIALLHPAGYARLLEDISARGGAWLDPDTAVGERSFDAAMLAAGAAIDAATSVLDAPRARPFGLVRPPGHHARPAQGMGFCLFNNIALAAKALVERHDVARVAVIDFDVHHGNGTQEAFYADPRVFFLSIHRSPFYPGTGDEDETGAGAGLGTTVNVPVAAGTPVARYRERFTRALERVDRFRPEVILISAGFDAHRDDPIGGLGLTAEDFAGLTQEIVAVAEAHAGGRVASLLEGGYDLKALRDSVVAHLRALRPGSGA